MNIAIWGTRKEAYYLYEKINTQKDSKVICFLDNDKNMHGKSIEEVSVYSLDDLKKKSICNVDTIILALRNGYSIASILNQLKEMEIRHIGILKPSAFDFREDIGLKEDSEQIMWIDTLKKPLFPYLQVILIKTCNLNCKGCTHFANLFNKEIESDNVYEIGKLKDDLQILSEKIIISRLRLLGGETFLYPYLKEIVEFARICFPDTDIRIVTNGLLLLKASKELLKSIHYNEVGIDISLYAPTIKIKDMIIKILEQYHIKYNFEGTGDNGIEIFEKNICIDGKSDPNKAMSRCHSKQCITLLNGKLYKCPFDAFAYKFFNYFSFKYDGYDGHNIRNKKIEWTEILNDIYMHPIELCKYCSERIESFNWENTLNPHYTDWTVL